MLKAVLHPCCGSIHQDIVKLSMLGVHINHGIFSFGEFEHSMRLVLVLKTISAWLGIIFVARMLQIILLVNQ